MLSNTDKISIYYKLLNLSEKQNDYLSAVLYIENIEILSGLNENDRVISGPYIAISQKLKEIF